MTLLSVQPAAGLVNTMQRAGHSSEELHLAYDGELGEELPTDELHVAYGELHIDSASGACDGSVRDRCEVTG